MNKIELLAPAGNLERLRIACLYGADAIYIAGTKYGLRANAKNFTNDDLSKVKEIPHVKDAERKLSVTATTDKDKTLLLNS